MCSRILSIPAIKALRISSLQQKPLRSWRRSDITVYMDLVELFFSLIDLKFNNLCWYDLLLLFERLINDYLQVITFLYLKTL